MVVIAHVFIKDLLDIFIVLKVEFVLYFSQKERDCLLRRQFLPLELRKSKFNRLVEGGWTMVLINN